jgi:hypothetical protein
VRVTNVDKAKTRKLGLSIKAREIAEEKEAVEQYGSSDSGASLGDILGGAGPQGPRLIRSLLRRHRKAPPAAGPSAFRVQVPVFVCQRANLALIVGREKHRGGRCPGRPDHRGDFE